MSETATAETQTLVPVMQKPKANPAEQARRIQQANTYMSNRMWVGHILQVMRVLPSNSCPTAGVFYDDKLKSLNLVYNPDFLAKQDDLEIMGLMMHEVCHITEMHVYMYRKSSKPDSKRLNFAMDLVINQKITTTNFGTAEAPMYPKLPKGALLIKDFQDKHGNPFPPNLSVEAYYDLLEDSKYTGEGSGNGEPMEMDEHFWDNIDQKEMAEAVSALLKRAQNHYEKAKGTKSADIEDYLQQYAKIIKGVNFKEILNSSLRQLTPGTDIKKTWSKPSRRFGNKAKGKQFKPSPTVSIYGDTSGSMTIDELNDIITMMGSFLESGAKKVHLNLFHSNMYFSKPFKKGDKFKSEELRSGGTDLSDCFKHIEEEDVDLAVFITDGYYDMPYMPKNLTANCFFIIKQGGNTNHCLKPYGKTIIYESQQK